MSHGGSVSGAALAAGLAGAGLAMALLRRQQRDSARASSAAGPALSSVLLVGSGGREHAIAKELAKSPYLTENGTLFVAPGNGGTAALDSVSACRVQNVAIAATDVDNLVHFASHNQIGLVVVGPEDPLAAGLADRLRSAGIPCFGPSQKAAQLEASKAYCKAFMQEHGIPTATYRTFAADQVEEAVAWVESAESPSRVVVKASGLAAGKGVVLPPTKAEAAAAVRGMLDGTLFKGAGSTVVVEEFLTGTEASIMALCDGHTAVPLPAAQDHKRAYEFDEGLNTGGMGVVAPSPLVTPAVLAEVQRRVLQPTLDGLREAGTPFVGVLFAGLMLTPDASAPGGQRVNVLEFNVRFGDPETQAVLPLLAPQCDLLSAMVACTRAELAPDALAVRQGAHSAVVVAASSGYPQAYRKGLPITIGGLGGDSIRTTGAGILGAGPVDGTTVYHAGTKWTQGGSGGGKLDRSAMAGARDEAGSVELVTSGGRVLGVQGTGSSPAEALHRAYAGIEQVSFPSMHYRRDIGGRYTRPRAWEPLRIGVLGSTNGTDLAHIFSAIDGTGPFQASGKLDAQVAIVISDKPSSGILAKARARGVSTAEVKYRRSRPRHESDAEVVSLLEEANVDLVLLIGFMRIVTPTLVRRYRWRMLNVHPSLLPRHAGGMDLNVHQAVLDAGDAETGCSVHFVEEQVDAGPVLAQLACPVHAGRDTAADLKQRVQLLEGRALADCIRLYQDRYGFLAALRRGAGGVGAAFPSAAAEAALVACMGPAVRTGANAAAAADAATQAAPAAAAGGGGDSLTYASAGVDIDAGNSFVELIKPLCKATARPGADAQLGGFGGLFDLQATGFQDPLLVAGTDGVGTKLIVAREAGIRSTVGIDLVAMCANDVLAQGAEPLFFLDYMATGRLHATEAAEVVGGIAEGCRQAGCALIGGEMAELPGMMGPGEYELAGFVVGAVERTAVLPRMAEVRPGDVLLGLASSGVHSNGFSLVRRVVEACGAQWSDPAPFASTAPTLAAALLAPTRIYVRALKPLLSSAAARAGRGAVKAVAHITGGGLPENLPRVLPDGVAVEVDATNWGIADVFKWLAAGGGSGSAVPTSEMARTFNCGIGCVVVVAAADADEVSAQLERAGEAVFHIGGVVAGEAAAGAQAAQAEGADVLADDRVIIRNLAKALARSLPEDGSNEGEIV